MNETNPRHPRRSTCTSPWTSPTLGDNDDLFQAGLTSHASVSLMLALEEEFDLEFPDELLRRDSFESIAAIARSLGSISDGRAA